MMLVPLHTGMHFLSYTAYYHLLVDTHCYDAATPKGKPLSVRKLRISCVQAGFNDLPDSTAARCCTNAAESTGEQPGSDQSMRRHHDERSRFQCHNTACITHGPSSKVTAKSGDVWTQG